MTCPYWKEGLTSWLSFVVFNCEFVTFPLVSWVRCGTWLYRFLIFAPLLTFSWCGSILKTGQPAYIFKCLVLTFLAGVYAWWSTQSRLTPLLSSLIARRWVGLQTLWWFELIDLSIDKMVRAWCFGCLPGPPGLPVGFLLLQYSVLFTVESLSLLYLLVISWFICFRRWCIDKLGVFHANQISMCLDSHLN